MIQSSQTFTVGLEEVETKFCQNFINFEGSHAREKVIRRTLKGIDYSFLMETSILIRDSDKTLMSIVEILSSAVENKDFSTDFSMSKIDSKDSSPNPSRSLADAKEELLQVPPQDETPEEPKLVVASIEELDSDMVVDAMSSYKGATKLSMRG